jgi:hypothetical protein
VSGPVHNPALLPPGVGATPGATRPDAAAGQAPVRGPAFADVLANRAAEVRFSGHALDRVRRRGIEVGPDVQRRLGAGVDRAAAKGSRDHVFTNIDSAVIA